MIAYFTHKIYPDLQDRDLQDRLEDTIKKVRFYYMQYKSRITQYLKL